MMKWIHPAGEQPWKHRLRGNTCTACSGKFLSVVTSAKFTCTPTFARFDHCSKFFYHANYCLALAIIDKSLKTIIIIKFVVGVKNSKISDNSLINSVTTLNLSRIAPLQFFKSSKVNCVQNKGKTNNYAYHFSITLYHSTIMSSKKGKTARKGISSDKILAEFTACKIFSPSPKRRLEDDEASSRNTKAGKLEITAGMSDKEQEGKHNEIMLNINLLLMICNLKSIFFCSFAAKKLISICINSLDHYLSELEDGVVTHSIDDNGTKPWIEMDDEIFSDEDNDFLNESKNLMDSSFSDMLGTNRCGSGIS